MWWSDSYHEDLPLEVFMARLLGNSAVVPQVFEQPQIRLLQINWITDFCVVFPQIALAIGVPYSKCRGEGSQIFWILFGGAVGQGVVRGTGRIVRCSIGGAYEWVYADFLDLFMGGNTFLQRNDATLLFRVCCCFCFNSQRKETQ